VSLATIIVKTDDGRVIHKERLTLAVEQERRVAPLLQAMSERLGRPPYEAAPTHRPMAVESAVGRTFD
jgi:hypothetical protein